MNFEHKYMFKMNFFVHKIMNEASNLSARTTACS